MESVKDALARKMWARPVVRYKTPNDANVILDFGVDNLDWILDFLNTSSKVKWSFLVRVIGKDNSNITKDPVNLYIRLGDRDMLVGPIRYPNMNKIKRTTTINNVFDATTVFYNRLSWGWMCYPEQIDVFTPLFYHVKGIAGAGPDFNSVPEEKLSGYSLEQMWNAREFFLKTNRQNHYGLWNKFSGSENLTDEMVLYFQRQLLWGQMWTYKAPQAVLETVIKNAKKNHKNKMPRDFWSYVWTKSEVDEGFMTKHMKEINWDMICHRQKLTETFIRTWKGKLNWENLCKYQELREEFIAHHTEHVEWLEISQFQKLSKNFLITYSDKIRWGWLFHNKKIDAPKIIEELKGCVDFKEILIKSEGEHYRPWIEGLLDNKEK